MEEAEFHNRTRELESLRMALESKKSELIIVYGRRGVGKSAMLQEAVRRTGREHIYYRATRRTLPIQLENLTDAAREAFPNALLQQSFGSTTNFLDFLAHEAGLREKVGNPSPVVVVIDELSYLTDQDPGLLTTIQHWWDANKRRPNLKIFLAGSFVTFMERQVLDVNAPLYNRRTGAMKVEPLDYYEASLFFPDYSLEDKIVLYSILGGMPSYLEQFDPRASIEENVKSTILRENTYLSEEPDWLLLEDLRKDVMYGSILRAVAMRQRRPSDISVAIGKKSAQDTSPHLKMLTEMGLLTREVPVTERRDVRGRNSLYFVSDNYLDFWHQFVDPSRSLIAKGLGTRVWDQNIAPRLPEYVSRPTFERVAREYLWRLMVRGEVPVGYEFTDVGTWWGAGDREIDVMALNETGRLCVAGSCKWTNCPMDVSDYADLQHDLAVAGILGGGKWPAPALALFSKSGFTARLRAIAKNHGPEPLMLIGLKELFAK